MKKLNNLKKNLKFSKFVQFTNKSFTLEKSQLFIERNVYSGHKVYLIIQQLHLIHGNNDITKPNNNLTEVN